MQHLNELPEKIKVIVRAWGDEPVVLFMHSIYNTTAYVGKEHSKTVIGLPREQVFLFNEATFVLMRSEFDCGNVDNLSSIYSDLEINSPCNRYQDSLESQHDKENITDSGSVASSSEQ